MNTLNKIWLWHVHFVSKKGEKLVMPQVLVPWTARTILETLAQHHDMLREMGVRELGLFGSYRQDTARPDSDMDFLVTLEHPTFDSYMDLKFWLEDTFACRVDLVLSHTIKPRIRDCILNEVVYVEGLQALSGRHPGSNQTDRAISVRD